MNDNVMFLIRNQPIYKYTFYFFTWLLYSSVPWNSFHSVELGT